MGIFFDLTHILDNKSKYHLNVLYSVPKKINWWFAPIFVAIWIILYVTVVLNLSILLPTPLTIKDEPNNPDRFIAERAYSVLEGLVNLGPRIVGSEANEVKAVEYLLNEIGKVREQSNEYFDIESDVQTVTGSYMHWTMVNMYQGVQNVVVKLSAKDTNSSSYLLINSHFDSVPGSTGGGDDGSMVAVMLEVMRVIANSSGPLEHPIVFLFNGAEENPLQASHGFITQHKWAKNCKALINLDACGNGGKEVLFQSGPKHPWLMRYYRKHAMHPYASTMAEEIFQAKLIPSDTDFRIFRDFGGVPGLDFAYTYNGYVYHTEHDRADIVPMGSLQNTGDNILAVAKAIANAPEMYNTEEHEDGHVVFYDFLGWFFIFYTQTVSTIINLVICAAALAAIGTSIFFMIIRSGLGIDEILKRFASVIGLQMLSLILGIVLSLLVALFMDVINLSMTWFSQMWLLIGLYFCPMFFGMGIIPAIYCQYKKRDQLSLGFRIQLFMHAHCLFLVVLTLCLTLLGYRSAFMAMLAVLFDIIALIINLATKWHRRAYLFAVTVIVCQIVPFIYFTNITYSFVYTLVPMMGRNGSDVNPDLMIAALCVFMSILFAGFLMPLLLFFRKTRMLISGFLVVTLVFFIIAVTPAGFPYQEKTAVQRINLIHARRVLHDFDSSVRLNDSGIYVYPQDRRTSTLDDLVPVKRKSQKVSDFCKTEMFCGVPAYNHRWNKACEYSSWIDFSEPDLPSIPKLELLAKEVTPSSARFDFKLSGPDHMTIFIGTKNDAKVKNWTFNDTSIRENWEQPYFIYFSYGVDSTALQFFVEIEKTGGNFSEPNLEIGIGAHWVHDNAQKTKDFQEFLDSFPVWSYVSNWVASYESWVF
ncbi:endoplasmic reticulum metallopeptidase 1 isoform X1 [Episyrphus balteatus]|uniref:endoplasmic reticulum metallopeptidase 1 isoform X1 n=1 Tax=Episyrphus balteatus TaxID=286459 RepID=UPI0024851053|nr:endoplasmic reticulum metallopeptidase 1 isoform X1 [Episyrphus balteatus]